MVKKNSGAAEGKLLPESYSVLVEALTCASVPKIDDEALATSSSYHNSSFRKVMQGQASWSQTKLITMSSTISYSLANEADEFPARDMSN